MQAVREENMADLVHFIHTGQTKRPRKPRVVEPPAGMLVSVAMLGACW